MGKRKKGRPAPPPVDRPEALVGAQGEAPEIEPAPETPTDPVPESTSEKPTEKPTEPAIEPALESPAVASAPVLDSEAGESRSSDAPPPEAPSPQTTPETTPETTGSGAPENGTSRVPVEGQAAWTRLLKMSRPRATRANLLAALLAVLLGAGIAAQVQLTNQRGLDELSQTDLVRVLDDISLRSSRLDQQVRELESTRDRLKNGTGTAAEALEQAQKRVDTLGILAGTLAAKGPGITLRITDPTNAVTGPIVLDIIQELRDAGAESIDVGGVRVVASSFVGDRGGEILVDGVQVTRPLVIKVIGDSKTLSSAMTIPGGIVESVRQKGAEASVTESSLVEITSLHRPTEMTHAKPVE
ncbi:DUF881 domain-containing protein [Terracoccus sp. 273MFTsu3.1]|uniref:DUF881 domain-containing protein n=1 Tax=Terracoccus sp. 273MFTsu3.1 TaxID=1172188 RepID=UPI000377ACFE|nr:DUF881 domain-containing protein [Terracoccus sp. 273MFTsu3.1]